MAGKYVILALLYTLNCAVFAQEETDPRYRYDQHKWTPQEEKVVKLHYEGELSTDNKKIQLKTPGAMVGKFGKLYVYDSKTGQALLFNADGTFLCPLFSRDGTIGGTMYKGKMRYPPISNMDVDITGRILFNSRRFYYLLDGQLWLFQNKRLNGWSKAVLWNNRIYAYESLNPHKPEEDFLFSEYSLFGKRMGTVGRQDEALGFCDMAMNHDTLYCIGIFENKIWKVNISERTQELLTIDIPALNRRVERNKSPRKRSNNDRPVFRDIEVTDRNIYLLIPNFHPYYPPQDGKHYLIGVFDENCIFKKAFTTTVNSNYKVIEMAILENDADSNIYLRVRDRTDLNSRTWKTGEVYIEKTKILKYTSAGN